MSSVRDEILKETEGLPEGILQQVLQFIRFLRSGRSSVSDRPQNESVKHLEDEFKDYRKRFPRE
jgi:hypothetical protein